MIESLKITVIGGFSGYDELVCDTKGDFWRILKEVDSRGVRVKKVKVFKTKGVMTLAYDTKRPSISSLKKRFKPFDKPKEIDTGIYPDEALPFLKYLKDS
jgi:hypothetical protein